jgi:hypothetical protein
MRLPIKKHPSRPATHIPMVRAIFIKPTLTSPRLRGCHPTSRPRVTLPLPLCCCDDTRGLPDSLPLPSGLPTSHRCRKGPAVGRCEVGGSNQSRTRDGISRAPPNARWQSVLHFFAFSGSSGRRLGLSLQSKNDRVKTYLVDNKVNLSALEEQPSADRATRSASEYDVEELYIFGFIIAGSLLPSFLAWIVA